MISVEMDRSGCERPLTVHALVKARAEETPDAVAIVAPGRLPLTYRQLLRQVEDVGASLGRMGLGRHARIGLVVGNGPDAAAAFLAVTAWAITVPLNPSYRAREFEGLLSSLAVSGLVVPADTDCSALAVARDRGVPIMFLTAKPQSPAGVFTLSGTGLPGSSAPGGFPTDQDLALILATSGTTSSPKIVPLTQANICLGADNVMRSLDLRPTDRSLNIMPLFHIHGLIGSLLAQITAGGSVVCTHGYDAREFPEWLERYSPTWYTAVPTIHQAIVSRAARCPERLRGAHLRFVRSCSAPLPSGIASEMEELFRAPVIQAYGMTEAAHQVTSNPLPPRRRKPGSVGVPIGVNVAVVNSDGQPVAQGEVGEIVIGGPSVTRGYEGEGPSNEPASGERWLRTGDEGYLDSDGYLFLTSRIKEMINRAGTKIAPAEVDEALLGHPAVAEAMTFAMPHATLGEDVAAVVVLRKNALATAGEIRGFVAQHIAHFKVPKRVVFVEEIPKGATGKVLRVGVAHRLGLLEPADEPTQAPGRSASPQTAMERTLAKIWLELLKLQHIGIDEDFCEVGGDSLLAAELFCRVSEVFEVQLDLPKFLEVPTIAGQVLMIAESQRAPMSPSLVGIQPSGAKPPLFCVTAGTDVSYLACLGRLLAPDQPLYALRPGHMAERPGAYVPERAAATYISEIHRIQPAGPYFIGGWCAGVAPALELAHGLLDLGEEVSILALFTPIMYPTVRQHLCSYWGRLSCRPLRETMDGIARRLRGVTGRLRHGIRRRISSLTFRAENGDTRPVAELSGLVQEVNRRALMSQAMKVYPGRATLFLTRDTAWGTDSSPDPRTFFGTFVAGGLDVCLVSGGHDSVVKEPHVRDLARQLRDCLERAQSAQSSASQRASR